MVILKTVNILEKKIFTLCKKKINNNRSSLEDKTERG